MQFQPQLEVYEALLPAFPIQFQTSTRSDSSNNFTLTQTQTNKVPYSLFPSSQTNSNQVIYGKLTLKHQITS
jgi:hypothetical protein